MTYERFERDVPGLLEELYLGPLPPYRDDLLRRTAATSQRPGWTFIERWIPVSAITARFAAAPRVPWRAVGLAALLLIALAAAAVYIGSQQHRVPPPFGPAANGQIPFIRNGNIYLGDPVTGETKLLVGDPGDDAVPMFSPDGTKLAFIRDVPDGTAPTDVYVANADGTNRRKLTPEGIRDRVWMSWTPDSRRLIVIHTVNKVNQVDLFDVTGRGSIERLDALAGADFIRFRPPDGVEMLFRRFDGQNQVLYAANPDGTNRRPLVRGLDASDNHLDLEGASYTADGKRIFYQKANPSLAPNACCQLWVMNADGSDPHAAFPASSQAWDGQPTVSPDGRWLAFWHVPHDVSPLHVSVARTDGTGTVIQTGPPLIGNAQWVWSPDSSKLLLWDNDGGNGSAYLVDPEGGPYTTVPWQSDADLDWQRTAR